MISCTRGDAIAVIANSIVACKPPSNEAAQPMPLSGAYTEANWRAMLATLESAKQRAGQGGVGGSEDDSEIVCLTRHITYCDPYGPDEPLLEGEPYWQFKPADVTKHLGYWARDQGRSTTKTELIGVALGMPNMVMKLYESIPGIELRLSPNGQQLLVVVVPGWVPDVLKHTSAAEHVEPFNLDGSSTTWTLRRDLKLGRVVANLYQTTDDILILRVKMYHFFSKKVDLIVEEYLWNGTEQYGPQGAIVTKSSCWDVKQNIRAHHFSLGLPQRK